jgi:triosephosphate isomerase
MSKLLIANWKANKNAAGTEIWFDEFETTLTKLLAGQSLTQKIVVAASFPLLALVRAKLDQLTTKMANKLAPGAGFELGVQDISQFGAGSYTGAVSGQNLAWLKPSLVILGHSERRKYFQETAQLVAAKCEQAVDLPARPIICMDRDQVLSQAQALGNDLVKQVTTAYEPIEAIGTGVHPGVDQVEAVVKEIKTAFSSDTLVLYGGSVDEQTIGQYMLVTDGAIIGTAALSGSQFARVVAASQGLPIQ